MMDVLVERADAIEAAIKKGSPDASIIGRFDAIDSEAGMKNTESMLSAHPEVNCIVSISDGPAVGAYEAVKSAGKDGDDFGIFGSDLSLQALQYIKDGTCYRGTTDVDNLTSGQMAIDICADLVQGKDVEKTITMGCKKVTADNVGDYAALLK
jgi:ABC-type sugar transport system substrate-binding protein